MTLRDCEPIFIVGCERSGTTLLRLMLNRHPRIAIPGETWYFRGLDLKKERVTAAPDESWRRIVGDHIESRVTFPELGVTREQIDAELAGLTRENWGDVLAVANLAFARAEGKERWGDKTPGYVLRLELIHREFPRALIIHVIRDGRDVAASLLDQPFGPTSVSDAAQHWRKRVVRGKQDGSRLFGARYMEVRYEDLISEPEAVLRRICLHVGESFDPVVLNPESHADKYLLAEHHWHAQAKQPLTQVRVGRWREKLSPRDEVLFASEAGALLRQLGYDGDGPKRMTRAAEWEVRFGILWRRVALGTKVLVYRALKTWRIAK